MANLGDMVVRIVGDMTGFSKSLSDTQKKMMAFGVNAAAIGAAVLAATKIVSKSVKDFADYGSAIFDASEKTGLSTDALQEWKFIAEQTGTTLESITGAVGMMTRGLETNKETFANLGIQLKNTDGSFRSTTDIFNDTISTLSNMSDETERDQMAFKLLGRSAQSLIPILNAGKSGINGMREEAHALGLVLENEAISNADKLGDSMDALKASLTNVKNNMANDLAPAIISIVDKLKDLIIKTQQSKKEWDAFQEAVKAPITDLDKNALAIAGVTKEIEANKLAIQSDNIVAAERAAADLIRNQKLLADLRLQQKELILIEKEKLKVAGATERQAQEEAKLNAQKAEQKILDQQIFEAQEKARIAKEENIRIIEAEAKLLQDQRDGFAQSAQDQLEIEAKVSDAVNRGKEIRKSADAERTYNEKMFQELQKVGLQQSLQAFAAIGEALVEGELSWKTFAKAGLTAVASVLDALAGQLAALAAINFFTPPPNIAGGIGAAAGALAAYAAAGAVRASSANFADGGIVRATPGGIQATVAEAGVDEAIIPLDRFDRMLADMGATGGNSGMTHLVVNLDSRPLLDKIFDATKNRTVLISAGSVV